MRGESGDAGWKGSLGQMAFREKGDKAAFQVIVLVSSFSWFLRYGDAILELRNLFGRVLHAINLKFS